MIIVENIYILQNADFQRNISLLDSNNNAIVVTGFSANAAMKIDPFSSNGQIYVFATNLTNGNLSMAMSANVTSTISPGWYAYDVMIWNGTETVKLAEGNVFVDAGITTTNTGV